MRRPVYSPGLIPCLTTGLCLLLAGTPALPAEENAPRERLREVTAAIEEIEQWMNAARNNRSEQEQALREIGSRIREQEQRIEENRRRIAEQQTRLAGLRERQSELLASLEEQQSLLARSLRGAWTSGRDGPLKLMLNQQDPARMSRMLRYYGQFSDARAQQIREYRRTLEQLETAGEEIEAASQDLRRRDARLEEQLADLEADRLKRRELIDELETKLARRGDELEQLREDRAHLQELIEEINRIVEEIPEPGRIQPFTEARGSMPWPLEGRPINRFGQPYSDGNLRRQGLIIAAEAGTPVRAIHPGRVVFSDWLRGSGRLVVVDHGNNHISLYGHNASLNKQKGDWVNRGEVIATAGSDAGMGQSGVYMEIRRDGEPQDPTQWLAER